MLERILEFAFKNRAFMAVLAVVGVVAGAYALTRLPVDAFPDTTPVQVQVNTVASALNPEEVERQITFPIETAIGGLPGLENVRSISKFGFSQVVATFKDGTSIYDARQLVHEQASSVELPDGIDPPMLGPIATGLGEVFHYLVTSTDSTRTLGEIRSLHDSIIKPELRRIPGVAEVNAWGGYEKQYEVNVEPRSLLAYHLTLDDVVHALEENNRNVGGGTLAVSGEDVLVHGVGRLQTVRDIENVVIASHDGVPVKIGNVGEVRIGHEIRRGAVAADGNGEALLGLAFMLMGESSHDVTQRLARRLDEIRPALPPDLKIDVVYNRSDLVDHVIATVKHNLLYGALFVIVVLFFLLGSIRAGLIVAATIPLVMIFTALSMRDFGIAASLLSLGALDFGIIVDGAVVMAENNARRLAERCHAAGRALSPVERAAVVIESSREVMRPVFFGVVIITLVLFPVLMLEGIEGKLFRPMALTLICALGWSLLVAFLLTPALSHWFLPAIPSERESALMRVASRAYTRTIDRVMRRRRATLAAVVALLIATGVIATKRGSVFVPRLSEGSLVVNVVRLAGISIDESVAYNTRIERLLKDSFPDEIEHVWSRTGTAEVATDPMGTELTDIFFALKPRKQWKKAKNQDELAAEISAVLEDLPGQTFAISQPIEMRVNEMVAGVRSDLGIKIYGDDFTELARISNDIQRVLTRTRGAVDISGEQLTGQPLLRVRVDEDAIARHGMPRSQVLQTVEAIAGIETGEIQEGNLRFPVVVRLPEATRRRPELLAATPVATGREAALPLSALASLEMTESPSTITREWGRRRTVVQCNVQGRDIASFVNELEHRIATEVKMPTGYTVEYGGQFEHLEQANRRFAVLVPLTILLVLLLLFMSLKRFGDTLVVFTGIPFAIVGGVLALWMRGLPFSVSATVGFIALSGLAVLNGQVLVSTLRRLHAQGMPLVDAAREAGRLRLRPVLATAIVDAVGFFPMALSTGPGAEVQRPLATVVIGGVVTSTALTLIVLPLLFATFSRRLSRPPAGSSGPLT
jgi:cobalt-zinc-cadmium resistance protein CzcA